MTKEVEEIMDYVSASNYEAEQKIENTTDWNELSFWTGKKEMCKELLEMFMKEGKM